MVQNTLAEPLLGKKDENSLGNRKGLQYLHEKNIVHRDMRPNNILVTHDFESLVNPSGHPWIFKYSLEYFFNEKLTKL